VLDKKNIVLLMAVAVLIPPAVAKDRKSKDSAKDEIQVIGHVQLPNGPVRRFLLTDHYSSVYLYAERDAGKNVTLIDVTKPSRPSVIADLANAGGDSGNLTLATGTAALVSSAPGAVPSGGPQSIRIMDFSDLKNPKVVREFSGVTAMSRDERRGLVYIADGDGVWVLQQRLATDPEVEKAYDYYVRYGPSMYPPGK
jgi:hypothetical protein